MIYGTFIEKRIEGIKQNVTFFSLLFLYKPNFHGVVKGSKIRVFLKIKAEEFRWYSLLSPKKVPIIYENRKKSLLLYPRV